MQQFSIPEQGVTCSFRRAAIIRGPEEQGVIHNQKIARPTGITAGDNILDQRCVTDSTVCFPQFRPIGHIFGIEIDFSMKSNKISRPTARTGVNIFHHNRAAICAVTFPQFFIEGVVRMRAIVKGAIISGKIESPVDIREIRRLKIRICIAGIDILR